MSRIPVSVQLRVTLVLALERLALRAFTSILTRGGAEDVWETANFAEVATGFENGRHAREAGGEYLDSGLNKGPETSLRCDWVCFCQR